MPEAAEADRPAASGQDDLGRSPPAPTRATVFSQDGLSAAAARAIGEATCLCGGRVSISRSDYGSTVYCPSCGAEINVGERLDQLRSTPVRPAAAADNAAAQASPAADEVKRSISPVPVVAGAASLIVLLAIVWLVAARGPRASSSVEETWAGLGGFGFGAPRRAADDAADEAAIDVPSEDETPLPFDPAADPADAMTLAQIEALLTADDKRSALVDAQVWRQLLIDRGVSAGDPRRARLDEIIAQLIEDLTPQPPPPDPAIGPFRDLLDRLHEALSAEQLAAARELYAEATEMFRAHAEGLAPFSRRLLLQQARLKQLEDRIEGLATIERLLRQARQDAEAGRVLEALEARATALHRGQQGCVSSEDEEARLQALASELREPLRLARGKRAVEDAQRCVDAHDVVARNAQLQLARSLLPGLPESQIKPLMATVEQLSKRSISGAHHSPLGQELEARTAYEEALEHYARVELPALARSAAQAGGAAAPEPARPYYDKLAGLTFRALEERLSDIVAGLVAPSERTEALVAVEQACDGLAAWKDDARCQSLRAALRHQTAEIAEKALAEAKRLAGKDKLPEAVAAVLPATQLGAAEGRAAAERLRAEWQSEIDLRASLPAQAEHWRRIEKLAESNDVAGAASEIRLFEQRYPKTPHQAELTALKSKLLPAVNRALDKLVAEANASWKAERFSEFLKQFSQLEPLAAAAGRENDCQPLREQAERLAARIEGLLQDARRAARMVKDEEVMAVLKAVAEVLSIQPDHAAAMELQQQARTEGASRAKRLLKKAEAFRRNKLVNDTYKKLLESVALLDPDGEDGRQALRALEDMAGSGS